MDYSGQAATALYKYQWDLIHNPKWVWFAWLKDEEEVKASLPCVGWFDDCDDVLKILEDIRNARINNINIKINGKTLIIEGHSFGYTHKDYGYFFVKDSTDNNIFIAAQDEVLYIVDIGKTGFPTNCHFSI